jgi:hypothetical protein
MKDSINIVGASLIALLFLGFGFVAAEPAIVNAIEDQFTVSLSVTSEISFLAQANDITLSPALAGITGGAAVGSTTVRVYTNDSSGYSMTLTASSSVGMLGNSQGGNIPAYVPAATNVPDFAFTTPANRARFGYTVEASTTADLAAAFKDNGSACNTGSSDAAYACWLNASSTAFTIINRTSQTSGSGATTTIGFRVVINSSPVPSIPEDTYVATTTLTATTN